MNVSRSTIDHRTKKKEKSFVKANPAKSDCRLSEKNKRQLFLHVKDRLSRVEPGAGDRSRTYSKRRNPVVFILHTEAARKRVYVLWSPTTCVHQIILIFLKRQFSDITLSSS
ncbi:uncharacterized protein LOC112454178 [Temnothorax curvispinosus]|uniref:Uncharacterized protein LOC112454178 n=1 Tax=Temnothorax curvispinosus TaxID=300111 RepID=A0A6J1PND5_9HYME|nr:uncharacterized protein LOC112454178 [Temnothorax curvispinosus]